MFRVSLFFMVGAIALAVFGFYMGKQPYGWCAAAITWGICAFQAYELDR